MPNVRPIFLRKSKDGIFVGAVVFAPLLIVLFGLALFSGYSPDTTTLWLIYTVYILLRTCCRVQCMSMITVIEYQYTSLIVCTYRHYPSFLARHEHSQKCLVLCTNKTWPVVLSNQLGLVQFWQCVFNVTMLSELLFLVYTALWCYHCPIISPVYTVVWWNLQFVCHCLRAYGHQ